MAGSKGFVNKAKGGARALTARIEQQAARARIERARPAAHRASAPPSGRSREPIARAQRIEIERSPAAERLAELGVRDWPIWTKEASTFSWSYDSAETCYFLAGDVEVTPDGGEPVRVGQGDLVRFPAGLTCTWQVKVAVRKQYSFG